MAEVSYKLVYFDVRGRAEVIRMLFAAAGKAFEDVRVSFEEMVALKPTLPFGQLPVLEIDGEMFAQRQAIVTYLAKEFGFYGKTALDGLKVDQIMCFMEDIGYKLLVPMFQENDTDKRKQMKTELRDEKLQNVYEYLEKLSEKSNSDFLVGDELSLADLMVFDTMTSIEQHIGFDISKLPRIQSLVQKVKVHPKLATYLTERKPDDMFAQWLER